MLLKLVKIDVSAIWVANRLLMALACFAFISVDGSVNAAQQGSACSSEAVARARELLASHLCPREKYLLLSEACLDYMGFTGQWSVGETAQKIGAVKAAHGRRPYDVFQVPGAVYKSGYRMRFYYTLVNGKCELIREEILEE
jgi:hypothetical protein